VFRMLVIRNHAVSFQQESYIIKAEIETLDPPLLFLMLLKESWNFKMFLKFQNINNSEREITCMIILVSMR